MLHVNRSMIIGAGVGAGLMFFLDPVLGRRRRALARDKAMRVSHRAREAYGTTSRDVGNRLTGLGAQMRERREGSDAPDDVTLVERVRARLGRVASHPRAIEVSADQGIVTLSGDAFAGELRAIDGAVRAVRGVNGVRNELRAHETYEGVPALQGRSERPGRWSTWTRGTWSPTARLVAGVAAASSLAAAAAVRRSS